jgi:hypothetical protein
VKNVKKDANRQTTGKQQSQVTDCSTLPQQQLRVKMAAVSEAHHNTAQRAGVIKQPHLNHITSTTQP